MSSSNEASQDTHIVSQLPFFQFFYSYSYQPCSTWKTLKEKYRSFKQQSYATPKHTSDINYIKRFGQIIQYVPFLPQQRPEKIDIPMLQEIIEVIYDQHEQYFASGGWRAVKNKSLKTHLQEHLLLKLWRISTHGKVEGGLGALILGFFYTLNYFKTCNFQIKLFNQFLMGSQLDCLFLFILMRKKSRRLNKDLVIRSENISSFVQILKGQRNSALNCYTCQQDELGEVKLLLIYPQLIEYVQNNGVVLHQVMLMSLMECAELNEKERITYREPGSIDWGHFLAMCFKEAEQEERSYQKELLERVMKINLKMADSLFKQGAKRVSTADEDKTDNIDLLKQKYLQESFGWLIGVLSSIIYASDDCDQHWRRMYIELKVLYEYNVTLGNKLISDLLRSSEYQDIYNKYQQMVIQQVIT